MMMEGLIVEVVEIPTGLILFYLYTDCAANAIKRSPITF